MKVTLEANPYTRTKNMDYSVNYAKIDFTQTNLHVLNQVVEEHKRNEHPGVRVDLEIKRKDRF